MLKKENRLKKRKEFSYIYRKGKVIYTKFLSLYVVPTKSKFSKIGFSISNKIGNSVVRHKLKRRLSEIVRININSYPINNYVFVTKKGCESLSFYELSNEVSLIIKKAFKNDN